VVLSSTTLTRARGIAGRAGEASRVDRGIIVFCRAAAVAVAAGALALTGSAVAHAVSGKTEHLTTQSLTRGHVNGDPAISSGQTLALIARVKADG
jgi:hypothetical protein